MGTEVAGGRSAASGSTGVSGGRSSTSGKRPAASSTADILAWALAAATRASAGAAQSAAAGIVSSSPAASSGTAGGLMPGVTKAASGLSASATAMLAGVDSPVGRAATAPAASSSTASPKAPVAERGPSSGPSAPVRPPVAESEASGGPSAPTGSSSVVGGLSPVAAALLGQVSEVPVPDDDNDLAEVNEEPEQDDAAEGEGVEKAGEGVEAIQELLTKLGLMRYFDKFVESGFDTMAALEMMTEADMREECGMTHEHVQALQRFLLGDQAATAALALSTAKAPSLASQGAVEKAAGAPPHVPLPMPAGKVSAKLSVQAAHSKSSPQAPPPSNEFLRAHVAKVATAVLGHNELEGSEAAVAAAAAAAAADAGMVQDESMTMSGVDMDAQEMALVPAVQMSMDQMVPTLPGFGVDQMAMTNNLPACLRGGAEALQNKLAALPVPEKLGGGVPSGGMGGGGQGSSSVLSGMSKVPPGVRAMLKNQPQPAVGSSVIEELGDPVAVAMAAAQQPGGAANTLYTLAQMAQESAQYAQQAAALTSNPADAAQAMQMADAAEQASQRAAWATTAVSAYEPPEGSRGQGDSYIASIKQICLQASETAEQAANTCRTNANNAKAVEEMLPGGARGEKRSRVPCKFWESGFCQKGSDCPLSHNPSDKKPLPLWQKRQYMCTFFDKDKCIRGASCAFAHGREELEMIKKFKAALKDENTKWSKPAKRPGDWDCPNCGDVQFARNGSCRKCGEPKPLGQPLRP
uniref:Uncharacterized protein n=1 Tax=Alexandrium monilatum TaxID=311494 RepID=A0A6T1GS77_9DINO